MRMRSGTIFGPTRKLSKEEAAEVLRGYFLYRNRICLLIALRRIAAKKFPEDM